MLTPRSKQYLTTICTYNVGERCTNMSLICWKRKHKETSTCKTCMYMYDITYNYMFILFFSYFEIFLDIFHVPNFFYYRCLLNLSSKFFPKFTKSIHLSCKIHVLTTSIFQCFGYFHYFDHLHRKSGYQHEDMYWFSKIYLSSQLINVTTMSF